MQHKAYIPDLEIIINFDQKYEGKVVELYDDIKKLVKKHFNEDLTVSISDIKDSKEDSHSDDKFTLDLNNLGKTWGYMFGEKGKNGKFNDVTKNVEFSLKAGLTDKQIDEAGYKLYVYRLDNGKRIPIRDDDLINEAREIINKKFSKS